MTWLRQLNSPRLQVIDVLVICPVAVPLTVPRYPALTTAICTPPKYSVQPSIVLSWNPDPEMETELIYSFAPRLIPVAQLQCWSFGHVL